MKSRLSFGLLICSLALLAGLVYHGMGRFTFSDLQLSVDGFNSLTALRKLTEENLIKELRFNDYPLFFDELTDRWFYSISEDVSSVDPSVDFRSDFDNLHIAFSGELVPGTEIPMIAYTKTVYKQYSLVITPLPLIKLECSEEFITLNLLPKDDPKLFLIEERKFPAVFSLYDNRPGIPNPLTVSDAEIHVRGGSTKDFPKKGIRIELHEQNAAKIKKEFKPELMGLRADGDWLLYAAYNDQEKIRNVFSMNLWLESCGDDNSFGIRNGMEYRYVELFLNQQYWGLYAFGYPIDAAQMKIFPDNFGHYEEFLFKQKQWGPINGNYNLFLQFDASDSDLDYGLTVMDMYFKMLNDGVSGGFWHNDEINILDTWLFFKLCQARDTTRMDGITKNLLFTVKKTISGRKFLYTPWDADIYWGNVWHEEAKNYTLPYKLDPEDNSIEFTSNPVSILRATDPGINEKIKQRYEELRSDGWSDQKIDQMIDGFEADIFRSGAYVRDMERWPDGTYQDPALQLAMFREYVHKRLESMDRYIEQLSM